MNPKTNSEIHTLTGAYALDALSDTERAMFEHHMADCASCAAEVAELRQTAVRLGAAVAVAPPAQLRQRVLSSARQTRQLPPTATSRGSGAVVSAVVPRWQVWTAGLAAAACLVLAVVFGVEWATTSRQLDRSGAQATQAEQQLDAVLAVLSAPDAKVTSASAAGGTATMIVSPSRGKMAFLARGMPRLPEDRSYQLWSVTPAGMQSIGVLSAGTDLGPVVGDLAAGQTGVGVTVEPRGGSARPTGDPVMVLDVPA